MADNRLLVWSAAFAVAGFVGLGMSNAEDAHASTAPAYGTYPSYGTYPAPGYNSYRPPTYQDQPPAYRYAPTPTYVQAPPTYVDTSPTQAEAPSTRETSAGRAPAPQYTPEPATQESRPQSGPYKNCAEAKQDGAAPLHRGESGYSSKLDRDGDGVACES